MKTLTIGIVTLSLLACGCIPSVYPFYTPKDVLVDQRLVGEWRDSEEETPEDAATWKFELADDKAYKLTISEKKKTGTFVVRLFKLKKEYFLDLTPSKCDFAEDQVDLVGASMMGGHLVIHVKQLEPELKLSFMDMDWLEKHLAASPRALAHRAEEKSLVLTAQPRDLQKFILKHLPKGELFSDYGTMARVKPASE